MSRVFTFLIFSVNFFRLGIFGKIKHRKAPDNKTRSAARFKKKKNACSKEERFLRKFQIGQKRDFQVF